MTDSLEQMEKVKITGLGHIEGLTGGLIPPSALSRATIRVAF